MSEIKGEISELAAKYLRQSDDVDYYQRRHSIELLNLLETEEQLQSHVNKDHPTLLVKVYNRRFVLVRYVEHADYRIEVLDAVS